MKDYKEFNQLIFDFSKDTKYFANNYADDQPEHILPELQDYMFARFSKELDAMVADEELTIKQRKRFYAKLFKAKRKLTDVDKADVWFDKIFEKYFYRGILEHLIVHAIQFLQKKDLFVPKRLFSQIEDVTLLYEFTADACNYLGIAVNEPVEQSTTDENEPAEEQTETNESAGDDAEPAQDDADNEVANKNEESDEGNYDTTEDESIDDEEQSESAAEEASAIEEQIVPIQSEEKQPSHRFHRPGGGKQKQG